MKRHLDVNVIKFMMTVNDNDIFSKCTYNCTKKWVLLPKQRMRKEESSWWKVISPDKNVHVIFSSRNINMEDLLNIWLESRISKLATLHNHIRIPSVFPDWICDDASPSACVRCIRFGNLQRASRVHSHCIALGYLQPVLSLSCHLQFKIDKCNSLVKLHFLCE